MKLFKNIPLVSAYPVYDLGIGNNQPSKLIALFSTQQSAFDFVEGAAEARMERFNKTASPEVTGSLEDFIGTFSVGKPFRVSGSNVVLYHEARKAQIGAFQEAYKRPLGKRLKYLARKAWFSVAA